MLSISNYHSSMRILNLRYRFWIHIAWILVSLEELSKYLAFPKMDPIEPYLLNQMSPSNCI
jgi:hypothetical protein